MLTQFLSLSILPLSLPLLFYLFATFFPSHILSIHLITKMPALISTLFPLTSFFNPSCLITLLYYTTDISVLLGNCHFSSILFTLNYTFPLLKQIKNKQLIFSTTNTIKLLICRVRFWHSLYWNNIINERCRTQDNAQLRTHSKTLKFNIILKL